MNNSMRLRRTDTVVILIFLLGLGNCAFAAGNSGGISQAGTRQTGFENSATSVLDVQKAKDLVARHKKLNYRLEREQLRMETPVKVISGLFFANLFLPAIPDSQYYDELIGLMLFRYLAGGFEIGRIRVDITAVERDLNEMGVKRDQWTQLESHLRPGICLSMRF